MSLPNSSPVYMTNHERELARLLLFNLRNTALELDAGIEMWKWPEIGSDMLAALKQGIQILAERADLISKEKGVQL